MASARHDRFVFLAVFLFFAALGFFTPPPAAADDTWINDASNAQLLSPPFRKRLFAGELARIPVQKDKVVRLVLGEGSSRALVVLVPMKGGKRSGPKEVLKDVPLILLHSSVEAEYFALKVFTGEVNLEGDSGILGEMEIAAGEKVDIPLIPFMEATGRFVNLSDFRSSSIYSFYSGGEDISKSADWDRTVTLEFSGSSVTKTWKTPADRMKVEGIYGKMLIKIGYPFGKTK